jgi:hypothetical protein
MRHLETPRLLYACGTLGRLVPIGSIWRLGKRTGSIESIPVNKEPKRNIPRSDHFMETKLRKTYSYSFRIVPVVHEQYLYLDAYW